MFIYGHFGNVFSHKRLSKVSLLFNVYRGYVKLESFKLESLKLKSFAEVGKSQAKLERTERCSKEQLKLESGL